MTDHPAAILLDELVPSDSLTVEEHNALTAGAAALRALAQFRPHHPAVVVSSVYAVLHVPFEAVLKAREALGDFDMGRFDMAAAQAAVQRDRDEHFDSMTSGEIREKWGR